ncbi:hypothetical protein ACFXN2_26030 [Streptomyces kronopolitis]|uniref:hypothetical protein n=1 Tax=Streptomyces kronopolitis TaxID=1612435 RepID=UPI0036B3DD85
MAIVGVRLPRASPTRWIQVALEAHRRVPGLPVLALSQYVEQLPAREPVADGAGSVGSLLKDRVLDSH